MYDYLKLWLPEIEINDRGYLNRIPSLLKNMSNTIKENGNYYYSGTLENLYISIGINGISINGSLNKYFHTDNLQKLSRQQTELAIQKLSDNLKLEIKKAKVKKIEFSHNFIVEQPANNYYKLLGECRYLTRLEQPDSIYYKSKSKELIFYNKIKESENNKIQIPYIWQNKNVLRYEIKYNARLPKQLNQSTVIAENLYNENFYISMIDNYVKEYFQIKKNKLMKPKIENLTSKDAKEYLLSALIEIIGQNEVNIITESWKHNFTTSKEVQRFKKQLQLLKGLTETSPLINELDQKILSLKMYYR